MLSLDPKVAPTRDIHRFLLGGVAPRPIALVSTVSKKGIRNLAPFSFFNAFSANPPIVVFSPGRRLRNATIKDTYTNLNETGECVIHAVTYSMTQQMNLTSAEFDSEVDEFIKSGFTTLPSETVTPTRVKESSFHMECKLKDMIPLGSSGAAGNLAICEVILFHADESVLTDGIIDSSKLELIGRMGADYYSHSTSASIFSMAKPATGKIVGYDSIPEPIRLSKIFSGNNLGALGNIERIPAISDAVEFVSSYKVSETATGESFRNAIDVGNFKLALSLALGLESQRNSQMTTFFEEVARLALDLADDKEFAWNVAIYGRRAELTS